MRVAVVGGTGSFGQAVAKRLVDAGVDVVIGSRDAERARAAAEPLGATGASNDDAVQRVDLVVFAVKADAAVESARELRQSIGSTPVFSVCAELTFGPGGVKPTTEATSIAQRIQDELDAPVAAGLHSLAASNLAQAPPDEDALVCGDDEVAKQLALDLAGSARDGPRRRLRPARERPRARGHDRRDREREQALQGPRGAPPDRPDVSTEVRVLALEGIPEVEEGDELAGLLAAAADRAGGLEDADVVVVAQKVVSKAEGRVVRLDELEPSAQAHELAVEGDPRHLEAILRESARLVRVRPPLVIAETRHGFVCASAGVDASNATGPGTVVLLPVDPDASAARIREGLRDRTGRDVGVIVSDSFGRPFRQGTTDVALGVAGVVPLLDLRGTRDQVGYELRATQIAVADELASAAELVLGKARGIPAAIVRGVELQGEGSGRDLLMPPDRDLFR